MVREAARWVSKWFENLAVRTIDHDSLPQRPPPEIAGRTLARRAAIASANALIFSQGRQDPTLHNMGTTGGRYSSKDSLQVCHTTVGEQPNLPFA